MRFVPIYAFTLRDVLGYQPKLAHLLHDAFDELFKDSKIKGTGGNGFRMKLSADGKPIVVFAFERFDDSVLAFRGAAEAICKACYGHVMATGNPNFTLSIDASQNGITFDNERMAMIWILSIQMRQRGRDVDRNMIVEIAALDDI